MAEKELFVSAKPFLSINKHVIILKHAPAVFNYIKIYNVNNMNVMVSRLIIHKHCNCKYLLHKLNNK